MIKCIKIFFLKFLLILFNKFSYKTIFHLNIIKINELKIIKWLFKMSIKYSDYLRDRKYDKRNNESIFEDEEDSSNYLDIWTVNPFHSNVNANMLRAKIGFLAILILATSFLVIFLFSKINYSRKFVFYTTDYNY